MGDWFNPPVVGEIDVRGYSGQAGEIIRAKVTDDVRVTRATIVILTGDDVVVEAGEMALEQGVWYSYRTTATCPEGKVKVVDLPGHEGTATVSLSGAKLWNTKGVKGAKEHEIGDWVVIW